MAPRLSPQPRTTGVFSASKAMLSRSTLTRGSPTRPKTRPSTFASTSAAHLVLRQVARLGDRRRPARERFRARYAGRDRKPKSSRRRRGSARSSRRLLGRDVRLHAVEQLLRGRAEVRAGRIGGVVGRVDRLRGIVGMCGILRLGRRRPADGNICRPRSSARSAPSRPAPSPFDSRLPLA